MPARRRLLLVHAHPDDESLTCGATMARYAAEGAAVCLVTCTLGEHGEVIPPALGHLAAEREDTLGVHRSAELAAATAALGVTDVRLLGGSGRYRDSGMAGTPPVQDPRAFARADLRAAADDLVPVVREQRPQVVVTYDEHGGYGHPDHIQAHRVTTYALALAAAPTYRLDLGPPWAVAKVYWTARPRSVAVASARAVATSGSRFPPDEDLDHVVPDGLVTTMVDGTAYLPAKEAALRAHATQVVVEAGVWALSHGRGVRLDGVEHFRLAAGTAAPDTVLPDTVLPDTVLRDTDGLERDLFAGLTAGP